MTFRVGQKVVCVVDWGKAAYFGIIFPKKDGVYTIRAIEDRGSGLGLRLSEIKNPEMAHCNVAGLFEPAFAIGGFRPIVERKTDISIFTKTLTPEGVDA